jgi:hypothetical protein
VLALRDHQVSTADRSPHAAVKSRESADRLTWQHVGAMRADDIGDPGKRTERQGHVRLGVCGMAMDEIKLVTRVKRKKTRQEEAREESLGEPAAVPKERVGEVILARLPSRWDHH